MLSCQKKVSSIDCQIQAYYNSDLLFKSKNYKLSVGNLSYRKTLFEKDSAVTAGKTIANTEYIKFNTLINEISGTPINSLYTVLYINGDPLETSEVSSKNIRGISVFSKSNNLYRHRFFLLEDNEYQEIYELDTETYSFFMTTEFFINKYIANKYATSYFSVAIFNNEEHYPKNKVAIDLIKRKLNAYIRNKGIVNRMPIEGEGGDNPATYSCSSCFVPANGSCVRDPYAPQNIKCEIRPCGSRVVQQSISTNSQYPTDSLNITFNDQLHYNFRDSTMALTSFGRKYINYYYDLSSIYHDKINTTTMLFSARTLYKMNDLMQKIINTSGHENDEFLSLQLKNQCIDLIEFFKSTYNDSYTEEIFYDILQDMHNLNNKTVNEVKSIYFTH